MSSNPLDWSNVLASAELVPGKVVQVSCHGEDLLLYRSSDGACQAVTAYCPHMNNYMPNGLSSGLPLDALLHDGTLRCPFHGWSFDVTGRCVAIPPGQRVPGAVRAGRSILRRWRVRERNGSVEVAGEVNTAS